MNSNRLPASDTPAILSSLWICVCFSIAYADIIGFVEPGTLQKIIDGNVGFTLTPLVIVVFSLFQAIPVAMILAARWFRREWNRWLNIAASLLTLLYVFGGGNWTSASYVVFVSLEALTMIAIIWLAWRWRGLEAESIH